MYPSECIILTSKLITGENTTCPQGYTEVGGYCLMATKTKRNFADQKAFCLANGGNMLTVKSEIASNAVEIFLGK